MSLNAESLNAIRNLTHDKFRSELRPIHSEITSINNKVTFVATLKNDVASLEHYVKQIDWKNVWRRDGSYLTDVRSNLELSRRATAQNRSIPYSL